MGAPSKLNRYYLILSFPPNLRRRREAGFGGQARDMLVGLLLTPHGTLRTARPAPTPSLVFGKRAVILTSHEAACSLALADDLLRGGASVTLLVPLPRSELATRSDSALKLMHRIQRKGFNDLMASMEYSRGVGGALQAGDGNRTRVSWSHVKADDRGKLALALADSDLILIAPPGAMLEDPLEESARFSMRRTLLSSILPLLRRPGVRLERDSTVPKLRWAWLPEPGDEV
jgi:hypothetical protein